MRVSDGVKIMSDIFQIEIISFKPGVKHSTDAMSFEAAYQMFNALIPIVKTGILSSKNNLFVIRMHNVTKNLIIKEICL